MSVAPALVRTVTRRLTWCPAGAVKPVRKLAGHRVSLRVTVRTKAGATLTETIAGAYQTAS